MALLSQRKQAIANHFANAHRYSEHASVQAKICQLLVNTINNHHYNNVLEIGAGQGQLSRLLVDQIHADNWHINELCPHHKAILQNIIPTAQMYIGDAEHLPFNNNYFDLIISANSVQWFDNPLNIIKIAYNALQNDGQFVCNTFTDNNFLQIKQLTEQGLTYPTIDQWHNQLKNYQFHNIQINTQRYDLSFASPYQVLQHIKQTGVSVHNTQTSGDNFYWNKAKLQQFDHNYRQLFSTENGEVILTYEALIISGYK